MDLLWLRLRSLYSFSRRYRYWYDISNGRVWYLLIVLSWKYDGEKCQWSKSNHFIKKIIIIWLIRMEKIVVSDFKHMYGLTKRDPTRSVRSIEAIDRLWFMTPQITTFGFLHWNDYTTQTHFYFRKRNHFLFTWCIIIVKRN